MKAVVLSPQTAAKKTPPRSATPTLPVSTDPHPFITEFFGPAKPPAVKPAAPAKKQVSQDPRRAELSPNPAE